MIEPDDNGIDKNYLITFLKNNLYHIVSSFLDSSCGLESFFLYSVCLCKIDINFCTKISRNSFFFFHPHIFLTSFVMVFLPCCQTARRNMLSSSKWWEQREQQSEVRGKWGDIKRREIRRRRLQHPNCHWQYHYQQGTLALKLSKISKEDRFITNLCIDLN